MYCGDHEHYDFLSEAFGMFAHVNALQRDMCPSQTKFEGEVIAMALDLMHAEAVTDGEPAGLVTTGGTGSILHALVAYREHARETRGVTRPNFVKPETGHAAFDKGCHLFGIELRVAPVDPKTTLADVDAMAELDRRPDDRDHGLGRQLRLRHDRPDRRAGGARVGSRRRDARRRLPRRVHPAVRRRSSGSPIPVFDFRVPGVTSISADTHKYGYAFKGSSTLLFRDKALRKAQYFHLLDWSGGKYMSPGMEGSRSGGLIASTWASMVSLGRDGYREHAQRDLRDGRRDDGRRPHRTPSCGSWGRGRAARRRSASPSPPTTFEIYHLVDFLGPKGWRFNGQQYPNAIHMAVTRPQTRAGVVEAFAADLAEAIAYAKEKEAAGEEAFAGAIYGGVGRRARPGDLRLHRRGDGRHARQAAVAAPA